jgi:UDP-3-O-[3-hydroxymyristoyl] glucosamine N-acyltransferase
MTKLSLEALAAKLGATVHLPPGSVALEISGIAPVDTATAADVTFLINSEYMRFAPTTQAAAVIVGRVIENCPRPQIVHTNPYWAFATTFQMFVAPRMESGAVHPDAWVHETVKKGRDVTIYPGVYVSENCVIADHVTLFPGVYLGRGVKVGVASVLRANVVVEDGCVIGDRVLIHGNTTIGADGFGFAPGDTNIAKIPQIGIVRIEDDVEIGAGTTIDRAAMGETVIGRDSKLDSSVHVAHNVRLGEHTIMCGGAFVAGSAKVGNWVTLAGSTSVNNHVEIADRVTVGALAGVTKSLKEPGEYMGFPAVPAAQWRREVAAVRRLKSLEERLRNLEEKLVNFKG